MKKGFQRAHGYSLIELLVATVLFTIIAGTVFSLLLSAQFRYRGESNVTAAFQQANVAIDQIVRDVHTAGYPPANSFSANAIQLNPYLPAVPFAWSPGYPSIDCTIGVSCGAVPGDYDLIVEGDTGDGIEWIRYSLQGTTLMRGVAKKVAFKDPVASTPTSTTTPYLENVVNQTNSPTYPIFTYSYDATGIQSPSHIREVKVMLLVQSLPDPQTQQVRTITLTGQAVRFNPNQ